MSTQAERDAAAAAGGTNQAAGDAQRTVNRVAAEAGREIDRQERNSPLSVLDYGAAQLRAVRGYLGGQLDEARARAAAVAATKLQVAVVRLSNLYGRGYFEGAQLNDRAEELLEDAGAAVVQIGDMLSTWTGASGAVALAQAVVKRSGAALDSLERADLSPALSLWARISRWFDPVSLAIAASDGIAAFFGLGNGQSWEDRVAGLARLTAVVALVGGGGYLAWTALGHAATGAATVGTAQLEIVKDLAPQLLPLVGA